MPRSRNWPEVDVDRRVHEAGGWLGPFGPVSDEPPAHAWNQRDEPTDAEERAVQERAA